MNDTTVNASDVNNSLDTVNLMNAGLFGGLAIFYAATIGYYFIENNLTSKKTQEEATKLRLKILAGYVLLTSTILFLLNSITLYNKCGESQMFKAFGYTYLPWIIMFGSVCLMLEMMPICKMPFSNTIGYIVYDNDKTKDIIKRIFRQGDKTDSAKIIMKFQENPTLILNEVTVAGFNNFIKDIEPLMYNDLYNQYMSPSTSKPPAPGSTSQQPEPTAPPASSAQPSAPPAPPASKQPAPSELQSAQQPFQGGNGSTSNPQNANEDTEDNSDPIKELLDVIVAKEKIATIIWYLLAGTLVTTYSSNIIATAECNLSYKQLKKNKDLEEAYN